MGRGGGGGVGPRGRHRYVRHRTPAALVSGRTVPVQRPDPASRRGDAVPDRHRHDRRRRAGGPPGGDATLRQPGHVLGELVLHLVLPGHPGPRPALLLVEHRDHPAHPVGRHPVDPHHVVGVHQQAHHPAPGGDPRSRSQRGCLHGRDRPRRNHLRGSGPDRGRPRPGDEALPW